MGHHEHPTRMALGGGSYVVRPDGRMLLLLQERNGERAWVSMGGGMEAGESIEQCALRETREESGLTVVLDRLICVWEFWGDAAIWGAGFMFLARPDPWPQEVVLPARDGVATFHDYGWFTRNDAAALTPRVDQLVAEVWPPDITAPLFRRVAEVPPQAIPSPR
jgi:8-oxo-dGTP pyrophosphatase MutT (NUDIX family)